MCLVPLIFLFTFLCCENWHVTDFCLVFLVHSHFGFHAIRIHLNDTSCTVVHWQWQLPTRDWTVGVYGAPTACGDRMNSLLSNRKFSSIDLKVFVRMFRKINGRKQFTVLEIGHLRRSETNRMWVEEDPRRIWNLIFFSSFYSSVYTLFRFFIFIFSLIFFSLAYKNDRCSARPKRRTTTNGRISNEK